MKYIAKAVGANRFKTLESISDFSTSEFEKYELYEVTPVDPKRYGEILKQQRISELKAELQELGLDLNSLVQPQPQITPPYQPTPTGDSDLTAGNPLLMADEGDARPLPGGNLNSKVKNTKTGKLFTMDEMRTVFEEFRANIEKEVQEIMYTQCGEDGFKLIMSELRNDLPKTLPNGIPLQQVQG
jgi:hypothetical protein